MNTHRVLGMVLPTNEPDTAFDYILGSLKNFEEVAPYVTFLCNFQKPWTQSQIEKAVSLIKSHGFDVRYCYNEYVIKNKGEIPVNRIRHDSASLMPEALFYNLTDDDMQFIGPTSSLEKSAGRQFLEICHYMLTHPKCGLLLVGGSLYRTVPTHYISPADIINTYVTNKGLVSRNMGDEGYLIPFETIDLVGSEEEKLIAAYVLSHGLYPAKMRCGKVRHYENHTKNKLTCGTDTYGWAAASIINQNNVKYIREHYKSTYGNGKPHSNDVVDKELYFCNGGIDVYNPEIVAEYSVNYENISTNQLIKEINEKLSQYED